MASSRSFTHLTPHYVASRLAVLIDQKLQPDRPWLTKAAVDFLELALLPKAGKLHDH